ncbi:MAG: hypothetical protein ABSA97_00380 [Verrucomicrobiia bacterium]
MDIAFTCPWCSQSLLISSKGAGLLVVCPNPSCGLQVEVPTSNRRIQDPDPLSFDPVVRIHHTKRPLAIEWAHRNGFIIRPVEKIYDGEGNYWCRTYQQLSVILVQKGLIRHTDEGWYMDRGHPLYVPPLTLKQGRCKDWRDAPVDHL